MADDIGRL